MEDYIEKFKEKINNIDFDDFRIRMYLQLCGNNLDLAVEKYENDLKKEKNKLSKKNFKLEKRFRFINQVKNHDREKEEKEENLTKEKKDIFLEKINKKNKNFNFKKSGKFQDEKITENINLDTQKKISNKKLINRDKKYILETFQKKKIQKRSLSQFQKDHKNLEFKKDTFLLIGKFSQIIDSEINLKNRLKNSEIFYEYEFINKKMEVEKKNKENKINLYFLENLQKVKICNLEEITKNIFFLINQKMLKFVIKLNKEKFINDFEYEIKINCFFNSKLFSTTLNFFNKPTIFKDEIFFLLKKLKKIEIEDNQDKNENLNLDNDEIYKFIEDNEQHKNIIDFSANLNLSLELYDFQKYGLYWMVNKENPDNNLYLEDKINSKKNNNFEKTNNYKSNNNFQKSKNFEKKVLNPIWKRITLDLCILKKISQQELYKFISFLKNINPKNFTKKNQIYFYYNEFTGQISLIPIYLELNDQLKGGILADEMGLGKTITLLSLLYFSKQNKNHKKKIISNYKKKKKTPNLPIANNLIIVPAMLIDHWKTEILKLSKTPLKVKIYKNYRKEEKKKKISFYDIIITSYELVTREYNSKSKKKKFLFSHQWIRIILDEANRIKNEKTQLAKSIYNLKSIYKWCLTGTPIENSINDLYSLVHFLGYKPWSNKNFWEKFILNPLCKKKCGKAFKILNFMTRSIILRRSKKNYKEILNLKDIEFFNVFLDLDFEEKREYEKKKRDSKMKIGMDLEIDNGKNVLHIYELILRLRQLADHQELPALSFKPVNLNLILENIYDFLKKKMEEKLKKKEKFDFNKKMNYKHKKFVLWKIQECESIFKTCFICKSEYDEVIITFCLHKFCKICIYKYLMLEQKCPICCEFLKKSDIFIFPKLKTIDPQKKIKTSSKMQTIFQIISKSKKSDKILIFSHFVPMLKILSNDLKRKKIKNLVLEGSLPIKKREDLISQFKTNKNIKILLISIKVGGVGLNLEKANIVILVEPWWNPAVENQAIDRINRIGQEKEMRVYRLCVRDSIEERICEIRDRKDVLFGITIDSCNYKGRGFDEGVVKNLKFILDF